MMFLVLVYINRFLSLKMFKSLKRLWLRSPFFLHKFTPRFARFVYFCSSLQTYHSTQRNTKRSTNLLDVLILNTSQFAKPFLARIASASIMWNTDDVCFVFVVMWLLLLAKNTRGKFIIFFSNVNRTFT